VESSRVSIERLRSAFEEAYWNRFSVELPEIRPVLVNLHTAVIGRRKAVPLKSLMPPENELKKSCQCLKGRRSVWFKEGWQDTPVFQREPLMPGSKIKGPVILEQMDTTIVLEPGDTMDVDSFGNLIVNLKS
jgi:N-methylhydantoinase A